MKPFSIKNRILRSAALGLVAAGSTNSFGFFIDGSGHYSLSGVTQGNPDFSTETGTFQAVKHNFKLKGEVRANETASFFVEFGLFDNPSQAYLGDTARPQICPKKRTDSTDSPGYSQDCGSNHQSTALPGYEPYTPKIYQAYVRYATDSCIFEAGRRARDWGNGAYLSSGKGSFDQSSSIFDGIGCNVNFQKFDTIQFEIGFDKLAETGASIDNPYYSRFPTQDGADATYDNESRSYGPTSSGDDLDQFYLAIELDDTVVSKPGDVIQNIGMYASRIQGSNSNTDLTFIDLYTNLYFSSFSFKNEILFRLGKTSDPNWTLYGAKRSDYLSKSAGGPSPEVYEVSSIGVAGTLEYIISSSNTQFNPNALQLNKNTKQSITLDYAYAPGDEDGYYNDYTADMQNDANDGQDLRDNKVKGMAFHENYKPALILFNSNSSDPMSSYVDGVYDSTRVMNTTLLALGYNYESYSSGSFKVKLITAQLNTSIPESVKSYFETQESRPVGFAGKSLANEIDFLYERPLSSSVNFGLNVAAATPGDAFNVRASKDPKYTFHLESNISMKF